MTEHSLDKNLNLEVLEKQAWKHPRRKANLRKEYAEFIVIPEHKLKIGIKRRK
jgi:hypothetical protein